jgi:hypothetical protein
LQCRKWIASIYVNGLTPVPASSGQNGGAETIHIRKMERAMVLSPNQKAERRVFPAVTAILAGIAALNIASAVLALLAA